VIRTFAGGFCAAALVGLRAISMRVRGGFIADRSTRFAGGSGAALSEPRPRFGRFDSIVEEDFCLQQERILSIKGSKLS
jgi:hypothetical protein